MRSMIAKAEKIQNGGHSRIRSRSRSRERFGKYNTSNYSSQHTERKHAYQRPKENDDYYEQNVNRSSSSHTKRWKKDKDDDTKSEAVSVACKSRESNTESDITETKSAGVLSETEMNKLGARIIKAEIMGDEVRYFFFINYFW